MTRKVRQRVKRIDKKFADIISEASRERVKNDVDERQRSFREMTEMMINTPSMRRVVEELSTIPRRRTMK